MSGAIGLFTAPPARRASAGRNTKPATQGSQDATLGFSDLWTGMAISGAARAFTTDGYYIVPAAIRGPVDTRAAVRFVTGDLHADRYTSFGNFFFRFEALAEERHNGTGLTHNSTRPRAPFRSAMPASSGTTPSPCWATTRARSSIAASLR